MKITLDLPPETAVLLEKGLEAIGSVPFRSERRILAISALHYGLDCINRSGQLPLPANNGKIAMGWRYLSEEEQVVENLLSEADDADWWKVQKGGAP